MAAVVALLLLPSQGRGCCFLSLLMLSIRPQEVRKPSLLSFPLSLFSSPVAAEKRSPTSLIRSSQLYSADTRIEEEPLDFSIFFRFKRNKPSDFSFLSSKTCQQPLLPISSLLNRNPFPSFLPRFRLCLSFKENRRPLVQENLTLSHSFPYPDSSNSSISSRNRFFPPPFCHDNLYSVGYNEFLATGIHIPSFKIDFS
ncbi:hypothetical protein NE237_006486 [Protea cynaroides]|uniref:Uncharacterized protein n=1 Tax=Protea cynaroides TaxID=273540 RepID=A0A9Q0KMG4_9MAGN|nr:hypothetical protein NE237_006486 [Protea cynaroides]